MSTTSLAAVEKAESALRSLAATAEGKVRELRQAVMDAEERLVKLFDERGRHLTRMASLLADEAGLEARKRAEDAKMRIRERPIEAVAVGLGIGLLIGIAAGVALCAGSGEDDDPYIEQ